MSQIKRKFIEDNAVSGSKLRLDNNEAFRGRNAANSADVDLLRVAPTNVLEFLTLPQALTSLPIPTSDKQFVTVEYIKNYVQGKNDTKDAANYLADSNVTGAFSAGNATTPATITGTSALSVDGKTFTGTDVTTPRMRIALTGQTTAAQNGIYTLEAAGAANYTLQRASDFDGITDPTGTEVSTGAYFNVVSGTVYSGYEVILTTADPITINTTSLSFVKYPSTLSLTGGDMIVKNGNDFSVDLQTNGGLESSNAGNQAGQLRIKTDALTQALEKDRTITVNTSNNSLVARKSMVQRFTLTSTDITSQYVDLSFVAGMDSVEFSVVGAPDQVETVDFNVNYTGGTSSKTRVTFAGGLATGGVSALAAGDVVAVKYTTLLV